MLLLALLIWLAIEHNIIAPWWLWTLWAMLWIIQLIVELNKLSK